MPGTPADAPSRDEARVPAQTLALLYRQSAPAMFFSVAVAALLAWALQPVVAPLVLATWCAAILLAFAARAALFLAYRRYRPQGAEVLRWRLPYVATLLFGAAVWGLGGVWMLPDSLAYQALTFAFLCGMAGSALTAYSAERAIALATFIVTLLPIVLWFFLQGDAPRIAMALGGVLFLASSVRATRVLADALCRSIELTHALEAARQAAEVAARTDALTGLDNRRAFAERAGAELARCRAAGAPVAALLIDIDHFKQVNDRCGHASGDDVLLQLARQLRATLREGDCCGRLGGEEFGVLLPDTTPAQARQLAEDLRAAAAQLGVDGLQGWHAITVSIGLATQGDTLEALLRSADAAMYRAKLAGRNRLVAEGA